MKVLIIALLLNACATTNPDKITLNLPSHVSDCGCMLQPGLDIKPAMINWKDKEVLKTQVQYCRCTLEIDDFDSVENTLDYIKPATIFFEPKRLYPWDKEFKAKPTKVEVH